MDRFPDDFNFTTYKTGMMGSEEPYVEDISYWRRKIYIETVAAYRAGRMMAIFRMTEATPSVRLELIKELCQRFEGRVMYHKVVQWDFIDQWLAIEDPDTQAVVQEYALNLK